MKILVIGQGGREHAIVKALSLAPTAPEVHVIPGNAGMQREAVCHTLNWQDTESLIQFCNRTEIDFVVIGPEDPLVAGLADRLRERGILVVGPSGEAALLEGSKVHAKKFMKEAGVPTAEFTIVTSVEETMQAAAQYTPPYVLKADGLAAGKGVFILKDLTELKNAAQDLFEKKILGEAGEQALLEQFKSGWELSYLVLTNGQTWQTLPLAQDHKRLKDKDEGPNTGGMGTVAPLNIETTLREQIEKQIISPTISLLQKQAQIYRGVVFVGIMVTADGPQVLEYNVRFGDPETQVILPLLNGDWSKVLYDLARGQLSELQWRPVHSCCVVMAAPGYPEKVQKNVPITGDIESATTSSYFIHAATSRDESGDWFTSGGRVLGAIGLGSSLKEAVEKAYAQANKASWKGLRMRHDICGKIL